jgi:hypothetical protein
VTAHHLLVLAAAPISATIIGELAEWIGQRMGQGPARSD